MVTKQQILDNEQGTARGVVTAETQSGIASKSPVACSTAAFGLMSGARSSDNASTTRARVTMQCRVVLSTAACAAFARALSILHAGTCLILEAWRHRPSATTSNTIDMPATVEVLAEGCLARVNEADVFKNNVALGVLGPCQHHSRATLCVGNCVVRTRMLA